MQILKCSAITIAVLIVIAVAYTEGVGRADKTVTPSPAGIPRKAVKKAVNPTSAGIVRHALPNHAPGALSALGVGPEGKAEEDAAYAPSDAFRKQAQALYESGDLAGAEAACLNALDSPPIIRGQRMPVPFVAHLLGQVYLKGGQYEKAIHWLRGARLNTTAVGGGLDLDLALAYARLGDYTNARRFYSDGASLQYLSDGEGVLPQDLPGTASPSALEASILLAHGLDVYFEHRHDEALVDFQAAHQLAPDNALIAYYCATILSEKGHLSEAAPLYERAATGRGKIGEEGKLHLRWAKSSLAAAARTKP
jgi:tetratricopeptide (TPR) repeat protein